LGGIRRSVPSLSKPFDSSRGGDKDAYDVYVSRGHFGRMGRMALRKFIIERDIPAVGTLERDQLRAAAAKSNQVLRELGSDIQWQESYVAADKTFCVYLAKDEAIIRRHAEISGFPATKITEVRNMIDPTTERA
jgi:hypothetical protein